MVLTETRDKIWLTSEEKILCDKCRQTLGVKLEDITWASLTVQDLKPATVCNLCLKELILYWRPSTRCP